MKTLEDEGSLLTSIEGRLLTSNNASEPGKEIPSYKGAHAEEKPSIAEGDIEN